MKTRSIYLLIPLILGGLTQSLSACPVCMGAQDSPTAAAVNNAIFIMFGVLGVIFSGIAAVVFSLYRRAKAGGGGGDEESLLAGIGEGLKEANHHA